MYFDVPLPLPPSAHEKHRSWDYVLSQSRVVLLVRNGSQKTLNAEENKTHRDSLIADTVLEFGST